MGRRRTVNIFFEKDLSQYLEALRQEMKANIHRETAEYLLGVDEEEYVQHLTSEYQIEPLQIHFDDTYVTTREEKIPAERCRISNEKREYYHRLFRKRRSLEPIL